MDPIYTTQPTGMADEQWRRILDAQMGAGNATIDQKRARKQMEYAAMLGNGPVGNHWTRQVTRGINAAGKGIMTGMAYKSEQEAAKKQQAMIEALRGGLNPRAPGEMGPPTSAMNPEQPPMPVQDMGQAPAFQMPPPTPAPMPVATPPASVLNPPQFGMDGLANAGSAAGMIGGGMGGVGSMVSAGAALGKAFGGGEKRKAPPLKLSAVKTTKYDEDGNPVEGDEEY